MRFAYYSHAVLSLCRYIYSLVTTPSYRQKTNTNQKLIADDKHQQEAQCWGRKPTSITVKHLFEFNLQEELPTNSTMFDNLQLILLTCPASPLAG